ncbi:MAG: hypothetical protein ACI4ME_03325 [Aristaeellaceae bacterium]
MSTKLNRFAAWPPSTMCGGSEGPVQFSGGTCWQSAPITAATWNKDLVREQGKIYANHGLLKSIKAWTALPATSTAAPSTAVPSRTTPRIPS